MSDATPYEAAGRFKRVAPLAGIALRHATGSLADRARGRPPTPEEGARRGERWAASLGQSRGAMMKLGQVFSFLPSMVPDAHRAPFQRALGPLRDAAAAMPIDVVHQVLREELVADSLVDLDEVPLASASIGQVHRARLADGREVAVKVQYPGAGAAIRADLRNVELVAVVLQLARAAMPSLKTDIRAMAAGLSARITEELDYRVEAAHQQEFAKAWDGHPFVRIPAVVQELCTSRVLVQELASGLGWDAACAAPVALRDAWGEAVFRFGYRSLLHDRRFNTDAHPGNFVFHTDGVVTFLDFGSVERLQPDDVTGLGDLFLLALEPGNEKALWHRLVETGWMNALGGPTPEELWEFFCCLPPLDAPQPVTCTTDLLTRIGRARYAARGPGAQVSRSLTSQSRHLMIDRMQMGIMGVQCGLGATIDFAAVVRELCCGAPAQTPLGLLEQEFWSR